MRCSFDVVNRIIHLSTERGMSRRALSSVSFDHLSIDEKSFKKGHKYITVLSHPASGCVLEVEEGRSKKSCKSLLNKSLTEDQQKRIFVSGLTCLKYDPTPEIRPPPPMGANR
jgi:transposase